MPTAAKLVAAIIFGFVAFLAAHLYALSLPDPRQSGVLREVSAVVGVLCGWFVMGPFVMRSRRPVDAMGAGVRTSLTILIGVVLIFATVEMLDRAMKGRFKTPLDAILAIFEHSLRLATPIAQPEILGVLLLGGLAGGAVTYWAGRRWP
ncbi:MAG: TrgA family protein [Pseudotabrizicola sp.]|uniref:TrgA family protein n=1 Tax=Pseudotabrizicola sp. TaxID=2939647 RepID=UPI002731129C|nr:TrgA family protein [Pseudotabrizicola sp.]MDP2082860.1 TrgA family protein [Pseudotabrizicola sp.]MDZ7574392.1 TrgA family protein [Pseudotabrizicola sp.]